MVQEESGMFAEERREKILALLNEENRVVVKDLAERFQISIDSIRRDLTIMEQKGLLKKTHGGAIPPMKVRQPRTPSERRLWRGNAIGKAIAKVAVSYLRPNDTVYIGTSTLSYVLLQFLPDQMPLTIVTNSIQVADALKEREWIETYLIGGRVKRSGGMTDVLAHEFVRQFKFDISFIGGGGMSENGIYVTTPEVAAFIRTVSSLSRRKIGIITYHYVGNEGFANAGRIEDLDALITNEDADPEAIELIRERGVNVILTKVEQSDEE
ncbi:DeoR/GlpR transcriptional regulator [Paenibacillus albiflavus]|uniref:DeoR/GlpR transcriptional regulator n=1 Tax=Paenibacillus albiflavus TaxID=2545760 RepID=A0A4R4E4X6_9BACL|nr:DeoR/GlpR family DNA-binding transcription regulator [Paenibacillus albiflavus]TCZ74027.1 DeoR/GlpR transcriptional regulator [Paenibacillus albiflavus]